jgi:hypothetical protein
MSPSSLGGIPGSASREEKQPPAPGSTVGINVDHLSSTGSFQPHENGEQKKRNDPQLATALTGVTDVSGGDSVGGKPDTPVLSSEAVSKGSDSAGLSGNAVAPDKDEQMLKGAAMEQTTIKQEHNGQERPQDFEKQHGDDSEFIQVSFTCFLLLNFFRRASSFPQPPVPEITTNRIEEAAPAFHQMCIFVHPACASLGPSFECHCTFKSQCNHCHNICVLSRLECVKVEQQRY